MRHCCIGWQRKRTCSYRTSHRARRRGPVSDQTICGARHERLITVDISGYGETGEYATMKAYDLLVQAESGLAMVTGHPAGPGRVGVSIADVGCGMNAYTGILEALIERGSTGRGKGLKVSLFDAVADWMNVPLLYFEGTGHSPQRLGLAHPSICPYGAFATRDGALVLISIQNEREWAAFCTTFLDAPDLPRQPGFESNNIRVANRAMVDERVGRTFAALTRDDAAAKLRAANTAYGFVNDLAALSHHPALRRTPVALPGGGAAEIVAPAVIRVGETLDLGAVPAIGQNSAAIRSEFG